MADEVTPVPGKALRSLLTLDRLSPDTGFATRARLPVLGDSTETPRSSSLLLFEDGIEIGPAHSPASHVREKGMGRYQHRRDTLLFSSSDGTDPILNGRAYQALVGGTKALGTPLGVAIDHLRSLPSDFTTLQAWKTLEGIAAQLHPEAILGPPFKTFFREDAFRADYLRLCGTNLQMMERKYTVHQLVQAVRDVPGDVAECGCYNGPTAFFMAQAGRRIGRERPLHLFDSFEGLSEPTDEDGHHWKAGRFAATEEALRTNLAEFQDVRVYKGWIPERFADVASRRFCFVHIDVDLYQPTRDSVAFFYDRLEPGGMMLCDDYGSVYCPGARKAMDDFFRDRPEHIVDLPTEQGFIIKR